MQVRGAVFCVIVLTHNAGLSLRGYRSWYGAVVRHPSMVPVQYGQWWWW